MARCSVIIRRWTWGTLTLNGPATFTDFAQSRFGQVLVGQSAPARVDLTNGTFSAERLIVARGGASSFHQFGGSNQVSAAGAGGRVSIDSDGSYNLSGGDFKAQFIDLLPTRLGTAPRLNVTGGRAEVEHFFNIGGFIFANKSSAEGDCYPGVMELSGGHSKAGNISSLDGQVRHTAGTNQLTQLFLVPGTDANADYRLEAGRLESARVYLGSTNRNQNQFGRLNQISGVHSNSESIFAYGWTVEPNLQII